MVTSTRKTIKTAGGTRITTSSSPGRATRTTITNTTRTAGGTVITNKQVSGGKPLTARKPAVYKPPKASSYKPPKAAKPVKPSKPRRQSSSASGGRSSSAGDVIGAVVIGGILLALAAVYFALLSVSFALTSPGALLAAAWMKFNHVSLPAGTIWMTGVITGLAVIPALWAVMRNFAMATMLYVVLSVVAVAMESLIGVRAFAFGESDPPYVQSWLATPPIQPKAAPAPAMPQTVVAQPPPPVRPQEAAAPMQTPLVWRDVSENDTPTQIAPAPGITVPPTPTFERSSHE